MKNKNKRKTYKKNKLNIKKYGGNPNNRTAYLLSVDKASDRSIFSKNVLEKLGFTVIVISAIPHENKLISSKKSILHILNLMKKSNGDYFYFFEDDINIHEEANATLDEIIEYEKYSPMFFYLGMCESENSNPINTNIRINGHDVYSKSGDIRCLHALGFSKKGIDKLIKKANNTSDLYIDRILENLTLSYPANIVRYDLQSPQDESHKGLFYQDRDRFKSIISS
jgi:hypothetical protein